MGNGAKAQQKRERGKNEAKPAKSQLKQNEMAKTIICSVCRSTFLCTVKKNELQVHAQNKHSKAFDDCFQGYVEPPPKKTK
ncbi:hypothetical protein IW136_001117 [Coemansia sp. RSA 678]|nr:hypothetical protein IW136_001117 [Coemansia sp. RSA 678]